jgi:hypothetical protein
MQQADIYITFNTGITLYFWRRTQMRERHILSKKISSGLQSQWLLMILGCEFAKK